MISAPGLRRTQEIFWSVIAAPEGARPAVENLTRRGLLRPGEIEATFAGDPSFPPVDRLDVYANMYFYRLLDCLAEDFPRVRIAVGAPRFHNLVTDYLLAHPSSHPSLRHLGEALPGFVARHVLLAEFPYLADLARLDWARVDVFDRPDAAPMALADLAALPPERAGGTRFHLVPASEILRLDYAVAAAWRSLQEIKEARDETAGAAGIDDDSDRPLGPRRVPRRPTVLLVFRSDFVVYHRTLNDDQALCLDLIRRGESLAGICQRLAAGISLEKAVGRVGRMLQGFAEDRILAGFTMEDVP